jgi:hypothetical protein
MPLMEYLPDIVVWIRSLFRVPVGAAARRFDIWQDWLVNLVVFITAVLLFPVTLLLSWEVYLEREFHYLVIIDLLFLVLCWSHVISRGKLCKDRYYVWMTALYLMTASFFLFLGPHYARSGWLVVCATFGGVFYGMRAALFCSLLNLALLVGVFLGTGVEDPAWQAVHRAPVGGVHHVCRQHHRPGPGGIIARGVSSQSAAQISRS